MSDLSALYIVHFLAPMQFAVAVITWVGNVLLTAYDGEEVINNWNERNQRLFRGYLLLVIFVVGTLMGLDLWGVTLSEGQAYSVLGGLTAMFASGVFLLGIWYMGFSKPSGHLFIKRDKPERAKYAEIYMNPDEVAALSRQEMDELFRKANADTVVFRSEEVK